MGLLKARYQARGLEIVDTAKDDKPIARFEVGDLPAGSKPREHDMNAALAMLNVGMQAESVIRLLEEPVPESGGGRLWKSRLR